MNRALWQLETAARIDGCLGMGSAALVMQATPSCYPLLKTILAIFECSMSWEKLFQDELTDEAIVHFQQAMKNPRA